MGFGRLHAGLSGRRLVVAGGAPLLGRSSHYAADAPSIPVEREREARCPASICSLPRERALRANRPVSIGTVMLLETGEAPLPASFEQISRNR